MCESCNTGSQLAGCESAVTLALLVAACGAGSMGFTEELCRRRAVGTPSPLTSLLPAAC